MTSRVSVLVASAVLMLNPHAYAANTASGSVNVQKVGDISPKFSAGYLVRDQRNARTTQTEILLSEVTIDPAAMQNALDPHMIAINLDALNDRNYVLLFVRADGWVGMNATFSKGMTQFLNDTTGGLKAEFTARTATRIDGHVFSPSPLKSMDGTTYTVDLRFGVDVARPARRDGAGVWRRRPGKGADRFSRRVAEKELGGDQSRIEPRCAENVRQELQLAGRKRRQRGGFAQGVDPAAKDEYYGRPAPRQRRNSGCRRRAVPGPAGSVAGANGEDRSGVAVRSGRAGWNGAIGPGFLVSPSLVRRRTDTTYAEFRMTSRSENS